ncbi:MAG: hypothetical protein ABJN95_10295 [Maribacter sp.]|uniref:hypothetical protein n=1 Tax=Maribacter sp. TaxID=1897614 RepID=UPI003299DC83
MKNVIFTYSVLAALALTACRDKTTANTDAETKLETTAESTSSVAGIPNFHDADVQAYVESYEAYLEDYKKAVDSKDMTAFASLATKGQDLATKAQEVSVKVSDADAEKLTAYMSKKAEELQALSKKMLD